MENHLWRVETISEHNWPQNEHVTHIVVASTEYKAEEYVGKYLKGLYKVGKISRLGRKLGDCMYRG